MESKVKVLSVRVILQVIFFVVLLPFLPLLISRAWGWWEGWVYGVLGLGSFIISRSLAARKTPDILAERSKFMHHQDAQTWDKKIIPVAGVIGIVIAVVAGMDKLWGWTAPFPLVWRVLAHLARGSFPAGEPGGVSCLCRKREVPLASRHLVKGDCHLSKKSVCENMTEISFQFC